MEDRVVWHKQNGAYFGIVCCLLFMAQWPQTTSLRRHAACTSFYELFTDIYSNYDIDQSQSGWAHNSGG